MIDVLKILQNESNNTDLIYIYRDGEHWYAYEQSAFFLCQMMQGYLTLGRLEVGDVLWLARAEVDINKLPMKYLVYSGTDEYVLRYIPESRFHDWLSAIKCNPA